MLTIGSSAARNDHKRFNGSKGSARSEAERRRFSRFRRDDLRIYVALDSEMKNGWAERSRLIDISQNGLAIFQRQGQELKQPRVSIRVHFSEACEFQLQGTVRRIRSKKVGIFNGCEYGIELEAPGAGFRDQLLKCLAAQAGGAAT